jgi:glycosyltransferase involved in cell wall biosynthesis
MSSPERLSVIVPARNEAALLGQTLEAILIAARPVRRVPVVEVIVVDNDSSDATARVARRYGRRGVRLVHSRQRGAASARNAGAAAARGDILCFVDADTLIPPNGLRRVYEHAVERRCAAGFFALAARERDLCARGWWAFWTLVRALPLARAKAMSGFMFCTRAAFERFGPFDERLAIGEEWSILAGVYAAAPERFVYDRDVTARTSSRRMAMQPFGYARTLGRYALAVLLPGAGWAYPDRFRAAPARRRR